MGHKINLVGHRVHLRNQIEAAYGDRPENSEGASIFWSFGGRISVSWTFQVSVSCSICTLLYETCYRSVVMVVDSGV